MRAARVRETRFGDYQQIAALQARNGLIPRPAGDWIGLWHGNPAYTNQNGWPIGFVLENTHGEIVGSIENVPFIYRLKGRELRAGAIGGWVVDPDYRGFSIQLLHRVTKKSFAHFFVTTTVGANAEPVLKALQWSRVPQGIWSRSALWVTGYRQFVNVALRVNRVPCAGVFTYPISAALFVRDELRRAWSGVHVPTDFDVEICRDFDRRFDEFWRELSERRQRALLAVRDRTTLGWHFRQLVSRQTGWILVASDRRHMIAYAICERKDNSRGLRRVRLTDFQAVPGAEDSLLSLVARMLHECRHQHIHVLENVGCWLDRADLPKIPAPYRRNLKAWSYYYWPRDSNIADALSDPNVWIPSSFDGDASL